MDLDTTVEQVTVEQVTPRRKRRRKSANQESFDLDATSPTTPHTLGAWGLTPEKANLLAKHGRKVKTFVPLTLAASKEVLALGRDPTNEEFGEILGRNAERMVLPTRGLDLPSAQEAENENKQNYSGLTSGHLQRMYSANNLRHAGIITHDSPANLLNNVKIDESFSTQLRILLRSTARAVSLFPDLLIFRRKQVADNTLAYTS